MKSLSNPHKKLFTGICYRVFLLTLSLSCLSFADQAKTDQTQTDKTQPTSVSPQSQPENNLPANPSNNSAPDATTTSPVTKPAIAPAKISSSSQIANIIGGLAIILVLIYGLSWFAKRFGQGGFTQSQHMKIISSMPLGTRERLLLVDVGGKQMLLGVTTTQINTLHVFDQPVIVAEKASASTSEFSQKLMAILQQKTGAPDDSSHKKSNS